MVYILVKNLWISLGWYLVPYYDGPLGRRRYHLKAPWIFLTDGNSEDGVLQLVSCSNSMISWCVCVDLLKRSKTCTWISIFGSLWDLYLDGILTNLTYMKFKLQILYWFIARLRGLPLWYFLFGWHAYYFNLHEVCSFKFYSRGRRDTSLGRR